MSGYAFQWGSKERLLISKRVMATIVLVGLIWMHGVELYFDDLLVCCSTFPEFLARLREVLVRLEKHKITFNPTKCEFGLSEVEYVGYVINEQG